MTPVRVALIDGVVPSYRVPFLELLARRPELDVTCFHGPGRPGHSVDSVGDDLPVRSVPIRNHYWPVPGGRVALQTGLWRVLRGGYDAVVCAENVHNLSTWLLLFLRPFFGYGVVLSGHGPYRKPDGGPAESFRLWLRKRLAALADAMLVYTDRGADRLRGIGVPAERIFVSGNTLDTSRLIGIAESIRACGRKPATPETGNRFTLISVGRLYPEKRVDLVLETARELARRRHGADFIVVGDGRQRDELEALARDLPNVRFTGAEYDLHRLGRLFESADVLFVPTYVGLVVVHAFCHSLPILTSGQGHTDTPEFDYIENGKNGVLAESLSAQAFADEIERLMADPKLVHRLGQAALATARSLGMDRMVTQFVAAARYARRTPS